jgi:ribosomal protein L40E
MILNAPQWSAACPLCEQVNPPDAKFCNACGTAIDLAPCPNCGAVNDPTATSCHQCAAPLPREAPAAGSTAPADGAAAVPPGTRTPGGRTLPGTAVPVDAAVDRNARILATLQELRQLMAETEAGATTVAGFPTVRMASRAAGRRPWTVAAGAMVLAVVAVLGYFALRERPVPDASVTPPPRGDVKGDGRSAAGVVVAPPTRPAGTAPGTSTPAAAVPPPVAAEPRPAGATAAGTPPAGEQERDPSAAGAAPAAAVARPRSTDADRGMLELQPPRVGPCTEGAAALGLCAREAIQRRE